MKQSHIVIIGGGYAGLTTLVKLQKLIKGEEARITLVNKNPYHYESTWLHEVSAGSISAQDASYPIEPLINSKKTTFIQDTVVSVHADENKVTLSNQTLDYDYLVFSLGFESESFGIKGLKEHTQSITSLESAIHIHQTLQEKVKAYGDKQDFTHPLTIVVGGGGFTGIEFLGELTNTLPALCRTHGVDPTHVKVICVEHAPTILPGFDEKLVQHATALLEKKGVEFKNGTAIKECFADKLLVTHGEDEEHLPADMVIWSAGVRGSSITDEAGLEAARGKVKVDEYLRSPSYSNVFVIGDCSLIIDPKSNRPYPPTAQISMQQGVCAAQNIVAMVRNQSPKHSFVFHNKGTVCSLGHGNGIGVVFGKKIKGKTAGFMKKVIDNRALFIVGGIPLVFKKGKF